MHCFNALLLFIRFGNYLRYKIHENLIPFNKASAITYRFSLRLLYS